MPPGRREVRFRKRGGRVRLRLAEDYQRAGRAELFTLLEPHLTGHTDTLPRAEVGRRLNLSTAAVAMSIHRMLRRYGEILRQEVAATVNDPADVEDELHTLMAIIRFQASSCGPSYVPNSHKILTCCDTYEARLGNISVPPPGAPGWFPEFLEAVAGQRFLGNADRPELVPAQRFLDLERKLRQTPETDYYTQWARRWLEEQASQKSDQTTDKAAP